MAEFYVRPQENGCRSDVRWAAFTGKGGAGVLFSFPKPLFVTATRYEWEDLDLVRHRGGHATGGANTRRTARPFAEPRDELALDNSQRSRAWALRTQVEERSARDRAQKRPCRVREVT